MKSSLTKSEVELRKAAEKAIRECVADIPGVTIELEGQERPVADGITADWLGTIQTRTQSRPLIIEFKRNGQPSLAREAVNMLLRSCRELPNAYGIFVAPLHLRRVRQKFWQPNKSASSTSPATALSISMTCTSGVRDDPTRSPRNATYARSIPPKRNMCCGYSWLNLARHGKWRSWPRKPA